MWNLQKNDVMCSENYASVKKMYRNGLNKDLLLRARVKKIIYGVETHRLSSKEKVPGAEVSKEGDADCLLEHKRNHHY